MAITVKAGDEVMTLSEAADRLGLTIRTLQTQADLGTLDVASSGKARTRLVLGSEVERYRRENLGFVGRHRGGTRVWPIRSPARG